jgi:phage tail protein X
LITADRELVANDEYHYRIAFINAFRKRGIFPEGVANLSVDTLCYQTYEKTGNTEEANFSKSIANFLRPFKDNLAYKTDRQSIFEETEKFIGGDPGRNKLGLHQYLFSQKGLARDAPTFENITGLVLSKQFKKLGVRSSKSYGTDIPSIDISSMRLFNKTGPSGNVLNRIIMTLVETANVSVMMNKKGDPEFIAGAKRGTDSFLFRGACTLIFDLDDLTLKHAISKPIFDPCVTGRRRILRLNYKRLLMQYRCMKGDLVDKIGFSRAGGDTTEPFSALHLAKNSLL